MGYSRSIKVSILRRVLPPFHEQVQGQCAVTGRIRKAHNESVSKVSEEMGVNVHVGSRKRDVFTGKRLAFRTFNALGSGASQ